MSEEIIKPINYDRLLEGKRALVTGGAQGIGREIALTFAKHGAVVAIADIVVEEGRQTERELQAIDPRCFFLRTDTGVPEDIDALCQAVQERFGGLDILDNNVGINIREFLGDLKDESFERIMSVNVRSATQLCRFFLPGMVARHSGSVLFTSSIHSVATVNIFSSYAASKGAINALARLLALEHGKDGIRVNTVLPGGVYSSLARPFHERLSPQDRKRSLQASYNPLPMEGMVDDIANAHLFFASDMSSAITGCSLLVDGGSALQIHKIDDYLYPAGIPLSKRIGYQRKEREFRQHGGNEPMDVYKELGVKTYINAWDTMSIIGGSRMEQPTLDAMREAAHEFVELAQLQRRVGEELARLTHNEAAYITCGASAGILLSSAVCMAGGANQALLKQLPDTTGMKNEILVMAGHRNSYDFAIKVSGAKLIEVGKPEMTTAEELIAAITDRTAAIVYFDTHYFAARGLPLAEVVRIAHERDVYVIVDGAAQLPPKENLWYYTQECGADLALFSGGKGLRGPQQGGLVVGKKALIDGFAMIAPPNQGVGRSSKAGREEIAGVYTAVKHFLADGVVEARQKYIDDSCEYIMNELTASGMFRCVKLWPGPTGQTYHWVEAVLTNGASAEELAAALKAGEPGILVGARRDTNSITINPLNLEPSELDIVVDYTIEYARKLGKQ